MLPAPPPAGNRHFIAVSGSCDPLNRCVRRFAASSAAPRPSGVGGFFQSLTGMLHSQFFGGSFDGLGEEDWFTAMDGDTTGDTATDGAAAHGTERPSSTNMFEY